MNIFRTIQLLRDLTPTAHELDIEDMMTLVCMLLEENCKAHGEDIRHTVSMIHEVVNEVNATFGSY